MTKSTFEDPKHPETGDPTYLSTKTIPPEDRLIFALDVPASRRPSDGRQPSRKRFSSTRSASSCSRPAATSS